MKVVVTANVVPFMPGGADYHIKGVVDQLIAAGHEVETVRFPFRFSPESDIENLMKYCERLDLNRMNGIEIDKVISLQFPAYGVQHDNQTIWVMHQHRAVYELYDKQVQTPEVKQLRDNVYTFDNSVLSRATKLFANSGRVAQRLADYNGLTAQPLYHPPYMAESFYCEDDYGYIFCPGRLEALKRQSLLIEAIRHCKTPVTAIIGGDGGQRESLQALVDKYSLGDQVRLIGRFSEAEKLVYYARSLAVFFTPYDEDYGYITLEAMLSSKPVVTCTDSGGPLEFVKHGETGFVVEPEAEQIAEVLDSLYLNRQRSAEMGCAGRATYAEKNIAWDNVVEKLLG